MNINIEGLKLEDNNLDGLYIEGCVNLTVDNIVSSGNGGNGISIGSYNPRLKGLINEMLVSTQSCVKLESYQAIIRQILGALYRDADNIKSNRQALVLGFKFIESLAIKCADEKTCILMKKGWDYIGAMR